MSTSLKKSKRELYADVEKIKEALADTSIDIKNLIGETYSQSLDNMKEKSADAKEGVSSFVSNNPFKSIGTSMLTGLLVGFLLRGK